MSLVCRPSSSFTASAICLVLVTVSSNFSRPSSCSAWIATMHIKIQNTDYKQYVLKQFNSNQVTFHNLPLKSNKSIVVQANGPAHSIWFCVWPKQTIPICKVWHVQRRSHLVNFWSQICKHVLATIHLLLRSASSRWNKLHKTITQLHSWKDDIDSSIINIYFLIASTREAQSSVLHC